MPGLTNITIQEDEKMEKLATALNTKARRRIVSLCAEKSYSIMELAQILNISVSTMTFHLKCLNDAGLINIMPNPSKRGNEKIISQNISQIYLSFQKQIKDDNNLYSTSLPLGSYVNFDISAPCGIVNEDGVLIIAHDNPEIFYSHLRQNAELIYFTRGFVEYAIPTFEFQNSKIDSFTFSLELCSECPNYNNEWKSDITFWVNEIELCTFRSLGDYGDRRGKNTPALWPANSTQYGMLKKIRVDNKGVYLDETLVNELKISDLNIETSSPIYLRIGIKETSKYIGGLNIFGKKFGDTDQDILVYIAYRNNV